MPKLICQDFDKSFVTGHMHSEMLEATYEAWQGHYVNFPQEETSKDWSISEDTILSYPPNNPVRQAYDQVVEKFKQQIKAKPELQEAFKRALANGDNIAITSFSYYPQAIRAVVNQLDLRPYSPSQIQVVAGFPTNEKKLTTEVYVRRTFDQKSQSWILSKKRTGDSNHEDKKNQHIAQAMSLAGMSQDQKGNVILMDDSAPNNVKAASSGYNAVDIDPHNPNATSHVQVLNAFIQAGPEFGSGNHVRIADHARYAPAAQAGFNPESWLADHRGQPRPQAEETRQDKFYASFPNEQVREQAVNQLQSDPRYVENVDYRKSPTKPTFIEIINPQLAANIGLKAFNQLDPDTQQAMLAKRQQAAAQAVQQPAPSQPHQRIPSPEDRPLPMPNTASVDQVIQTARDNFFHLNRQWAVRGNRDEYVMQTIQQLDELASNTLMDEQSKVIELKDIFDEIQQLTEPDAMGFKMLAEEVRGVVAPQMQALEQQMQSAPAPQGPQTQPVPQAPAANPMPNPSSDWASPQPDTSSYKSSASIWDVLGGTEQLKNEYASKRASQMQSNGKGSGLFHSQRHFLAKTIGQKRDKRNQQIEELGAMITNIKDDTSLDTLMRDKLLYAALDNLLEDVKGEGNKFESALAVVIEGHMEGLKKSMSRQKFNPTELNMGPFKDEARTRQQALKSEGPTHKQPRHGR